MTSDQSEENSADEIGEPDTDARSSAVPPTACVIGVGASAGGLHCFRRLLEGFSPCKGLSLVLIQHLDPSHESLLAELLAKHTDRVVVEAEDGMQIQADHVYTIPPNKFIRLTESGLSLDEPQPENGLRLPVDYFFRSLAETCKSRSVGIVLSGTGSDGTQGLQAIQSAGGLTIAQSPEDSEHDGMPKSAIASGIVDYILPIAEIPDVVARHRRRTSSESDDDSLSETHPEAFTEVLQLLYSQTDREFRFYKRGTLNRRIARRMGLRHIEDIRDYVQLLRQDPQEIESLSKDMLIGVTRFYRDPSACNDLRDHLQRRLENEEITEVRAWVPGCSTGEEAYTIAMMLFDLQQKLSRRLDVQVFATDIDAEAIRRARLGGYPDSIRADLPSSWQEKYFDQIEGQWKVKRRIRESCVFAVQDLLSDPPFSNLDLVSCRNVLIYLVADVQRKLLDTFHFSLKTEGLLFLGPSESPSSRKNLFQTLEQASRIYVKQGATQPGVGSRIALGTAHQREGEKLNMSESGTNPGELELGRGEFSKRALLRAFVPPSVVVDQHHVVQYIHGPVRDYLDFPSGDPELSLPAMALDGLKTPLRQALAQARREKQTVTRLARQVDANHASKSVQIRVQPLPRDRGSEPLYMISFFDASTETPSGESAKSVEPSKLASAPAADVSHDQQSVEQLQLELQATRDDLQSTIEELESANEELKASNEEVMSMNEELQSTNEELETSREELQSLNEELSTLNGQLHDKVDELEEANNDLANLLASTDMATLFLDSDLRIRRYTPATVELMNLIPTDVGRPLGDLALRFQDPDLVDDAQQVLKNLATIQKEVKTKDGKWFLRKINPFRTFDNRIEGTVVTLSDITHLKRFSQKLEVHERQQAIIAQLGSLALSGERLDVLFDRAVRDVAEALDFEYAKVLRLEPPGDFVTLVAGVGWNDGLVGQAEISTGMESQAGYTLSSDQPVVSKNLADERRFSGPQLLIDHGVVGGVSVIIGPEENPWGVFGAHAKREIDFTIEDTNFVVSVANVLWDAIQRQKNESLVQSQLAEISAIYDFSPIGLCFVDPDGRYVRVNNALAEMNGRSRDEHLNQTVRDISPHLADTLEASMHQVSQSRTPVFNQEIEVPRTEGSLHWWLVSFVPLEVDGQLLGINMAMLDITERKQAESQLAASEAKLQHLVDSASVGIAFARHDGTVEQANDALLEIFSISREEFDEIGWTWEDQVLPEDKTFAAIMQDLGESRKAEIIELRRRDKEDDFVWVLVSAQPVESGDNPDYVAFLVDVTDRKKAELELARRTRELHESENRLAMALKAGGMAAWEWTPDVSIWTDELYELLGLPNHLEASTELFFSVVHPDDLPMLQQQWGSVTNDATTYDHKFRIIRPDGEVRWVYGLGEVEKDDQDNVTRVFGLNWDCTMEHQASEAQREKELLAIEASKTKSEFLANMSHEIRTPMSAILGYADILGKHLKDPDNIKCVEIIQNNGNFLLDIINDILDISKIEAGKMEVGSEAFRLDHLISDVRSLMDIRAREKMLDFQVRFENDVPREIRSDAKRLKQILVNLVGNAVKFTDVGSVDVVIQAGDPADQYLLFRVTDTGIGISAEQRQQLFQPFTQADAAVDRRFGGTGLGLAISQRLAHMMGGSIEVESELGTGSTFLLKLQFQPVDGSPLVDPENWDRESIQSSSRYEMPQLQGHVLIVDDRREIRVIAQHFLEDCGCTVATCADGRQAIDQINLNRSQSETQSWVDPPIDLVVMDMQMPVMDGYEATRQLRAMGYRQPIIALTAHAMEGDRADCLEAGCTDYIAKPLDRLLFIQLCQRYLKTKTDNQKPESVGHRFIPRKFLIIDDAVDAGEALATLLQLGGHQVKTAQTGHSGIEVAKQFGPEVVLVDLELPDQSGHEVVHALRQVPALEKTVFVAATGSDLDEKIKKNFDLHVVKPIDIDALEKLINRID